MDMNKLFYAMVFISLISCTYEKESKINTSAERWSEEKVWEWYNNYDWLIGTNFNPSTAINQLEFWQEETFDIETIDRELGWSASLGMNIHRVYLHNLLWEQDSTGFLVRLKAYLTIADKYNIKTMFVLLDDVWHPVPASGKQPVPIPHVHNSGWVQAPGAEILGDSTRHDELKGYIKGVIDHFANDERVICWDLYNEPDNVADQKGRAVLEVTNKQIYSLALLKKVFRWAREINPSQPLTTGIWRGEVKFWGVPDSLPALDRYMLEHSDVISFHAYDRDTEVVKQKISVLKKYGRPLMCTEYLARSRQNLFTNMLPILKEQKIAAINWGLVSGKTNTIYPWSSWRENFTSEPEMWHHDIFRQDGTPFSKDEVAFIKQMTDNK